jgi:hypothetical protein
MAVRTSQPQSVRQDVMLKCKKKGEAAKIEEGR